MNVTTYLQFAASLVFVLALIGVAAVLARRLGFGQGARGGSGTRRLGIVEVRPAAANSCCRWACSSALDCPSALPGSVARRIVSCGAGPGATMLRPTRQKEIASATIMTTTITIRTLRVKIGWMRR